MILAIGSDHAGYQLKEHLKVLLTDLGYEISDYGTYSQDSTDYPLIAEKVALAVRDKKADFGLLVCGTGQGMAITANKVPGIRAAVCQDVFSARAAREHNNANILAIGARVVGLGVAETIVIEFIKAQFAGERHQKRVEIISEIEHKYLKREVN